MLPKNNEIRFETTTVCNYKCIICNNSRLKRAKETMNLDVFKTLLDKILSTTDQYDSVGFAGIGEPLCDPTLSDKIAYAKSKGLSTMIVTNASLLINSKLEQLKSAGLDILRMSFHGTSPINYAALTDTDAGMFIRTKYNIENAIANKGNMKCYLTYVKVKGVNDTDIDWWIDLWKYKADLVEVWNAHNWVDSFDYRNSVHVNKTATCGRPFSGPLQVQVNGDIIPCCFDAENSIVYGNLIQDDLNTIFSSNVYQGLIKCHKTGDFSGTDFICANCDQRNADKSDALDYSSGYADKEDRVKRTSTFHTKYKQEE